MSSTLNIYKASAGSGKTYTLTEQYIKILLNAGKGDPDYFRHILAVTFTNKATDEMKSRIVQKLYDIYRKGVPVNIGGVELKPEKAKELLVSILHSYSLFRITTIDKFFQQIIRSFVKELGISSNYSVEIDEKRIIKETIDDILLKIGDSSYKPFIDWFTDRTVTDSQSGDSLNFSRLCCELEEFSKQIFQEQYLQYKEVIPDESTIICEGKKLKNKKRAITDNLSKMAQDICNRFANSGLTIEDFSKGALSPIIKYSEGQSKYPELTPTLLRWREKAPINQKSPNQRLAESEYNLWMKSSITNFIDDTEKYSSDYHTCDNILKGLPYYQLFRLLDQEITNRIRESNSQILSKSGDLIKSIIDGSDAPFIYEKTGTYLHHFLIDEFQDTSSLQWNNFKPLIHNSLSEGDENLVVGDVKQSIYRFRNSDWSILGSDVQKVFNAHCKVHNLDTNYRSLGNVVDFNNRFFTEVAKFLQEKYNCQSGRTDATITNAYNDVTQQIKENAEGQGYVEINFMGEGGKGGKSSQGNRDEEDNNEELLEAVYNRIEKLVEHGYKLKDIGVLVRKNSEAQLVASYMIERGINVISEEALNISSNKAVSDIISILSYISNPGDATNSYLVNHQINRNGILDIESLSHLPLYEIIEQTVSILKLDQEPSNIPYINALKDIAMEYIGRNNAVIASFIDYWNEIKESKSLSTISESDSINIITIHKSKGLAYSAVIMPLLNWKLHSTKGSILWETIPSDAKEYQALKCVPVKYEKNLRNTIFRDAYFNELLLEYIDNLNDLYVAFTRAREVLIGFCYTTKDPDKNTETEPFNSIYPILYPILVHNKNLENNQYKYGTIPEHIEEEIADNVTSDGIVYTDTEADISPVEKMSTFKMRGSDYIRPEAGRGSRMHRIMEKVATISDLDDQLQTMLYKGYITQKQFEDLKKDLTAYITNPAAAEWFDGTKNILAERSIVKPVVNSDGIEYMATIRPDRVLIDETTRKVTIIDYKFGENKEKKHIYQVQGYIDIYRKAGYSDVTGYLYYFEDLEIVKV